MNAPKPPAARPRVPASSVDRTLLFGEEAASKAAPAAAPKPAVAPAPRPAPASAPSARPAPSGTDRTLPFVEALAATRPSFPAVGVAPRPSSPVPGPKPAPAPAPTSDAALPLAVPSVERTLSYAESAADAARTSVDPERTLADPRVSAEPARAPSPGATVRSTVLPRVEVVDDRPQLIRDERRRFELVRALGEGGAGEVLAVQDNDIGRRVALKKIKADVKSPEALVRFVEEIRTIGRLEHPNIIPIHDVGVDEHGDYYFVMKLVDGETLEAIIEKLRAGDVEYHRRYPFEQRVQLFRGLLEAVAFAHSQGIVHRDLKPANVMVGKFGEVLLMDWGIAKSLREGSVALDDALRERPAAPDAAASRAVRTQVGALIGTPLYMSPEQARGEPVEARSDVYSLSVLLYELLALRHYLEDLQTMDAVLEGVKSRPVSIAAIPNHPAQPTVPMDLRWFLKKGLEKDPARRYPSVDAMIERLDLRAQGIIPIQCHLTLTRRVTSAWLRFMDRHPLLFTAGLLAASAGLVFGLVRGLG